MGRDIQKIWPIFPVNTKYLYNICAMLAQRQRRWTGVVQMLYKCFVFVGLQRSDWLGWPFPPIRGQ